LVRIGFALPDLPYSGKIDSSAPKVITKVNTEVAYCRLSAYNNENETNQFAREEIYI